MPAKHISAVLAVAVVTVVAVCFFLPTAIHAQDCLDYGDYMHWVAALDLETASNAVAIAGDHAYVAKGYQTVGGLDVVDISVPAAPQLVGTVSLPGYGQDVAVAGDYAYVADGWAGLQVVDISDPAAPIVVGAADTPEFVSDVALYAHYAVLAEWNTGRLHVIDVADPTAPIIIGGADAQDDIQDLVITGGFAYVIYRFIHPGTAGLQLFDLIDPELPLLVADLPVQDWARGLAVTDGRAYVVSSLLQIIDVTNPAAPTIMGSVEVPHGGREVVVVNDYAYVGLGIGQPGLATIDVLWPESPLVTGVVYTTDEPRGLAVSGSHAYLANTYSGLNVIDVSVPITPPAGIIQDSPVGVTTLTVAGQYAYLAGHGYDNMQVIDITDPEDPVPLGTVDTPGVIGDIAVAGQYAYAADDSTGLHVIDVSEPDSPQIVEVVSASGIARGVATTANHLYATYVDGTISLLRVMDIATPSMPLVVGSVEIPQVAGKLAVADNFVYVISQFYAGFSGLTVVDVTDPTAPVVMGMVDTPGQLLYDVTIAGTVAYLASGGSGALGLQMVDILYPIHDDHAYVVVQKIGLVVVDITDPTSGFVVGIAAVGASPSSPRDVAYSGDHVYVASGPGLHICLRQCTDVVAVFCSDFTAADDDEFQVVGRQGVREWHVPYSQNGDGNFSATDGVAGWVNGEPRTYSLYHRTSGADWLLLATETVAREVAVRITGLGNIQPNPFNPHTSVAFTVDRAQHVEIAVYDLSGRRVTLLADQVFGPGEHTTHWDGRDDAGRAAASGTYVVRFVADRRAESRKIMLVR